MVPWLPWLKDNPFFRQEVNWVVCCTWRHHHNEGQPGCLEWTCWFLCADWHSHWQAWWSFWTEKVQEDCPPISHHLSNHKGCQPMGRVDLSRFTQKKPTSSMRWQSPMRWKHLSLSLMSHLQPNGSQRFAIAMLHLENWNCQVKSPSPCHPGSSKRLTHLKSFLMSTGRLWRQSTTCLGVGFWSYNMYFTSRELFMWCLETLGLTSGGKGSE